MQIWLGIFLFMSLTLNILIIRAYISREEECREILNMRAELEKAKESLTKTLTKNKKSGARVSHFRFMIGK